MQTDQPNYLSYLLKLWRIDGKEAGAPGSSTPDWHASLECAQTGEVMQFCNLEALIGYLLFRTDAPHDLKIYVNIYVRFHEADTDTQT